jgi:hypothetical protein
VQNLGVNGVANLLPLNLQLKQTLQEMCLDLSKFALLHPLVGELCVVKVEVSGQRPYRAVQNTKAETDCDIVVEHCVQLFDFMRDLQVSLIV